jgi:hypothetical protein
MPILPRLLEDGARAINAQGIAMGGDLHLDPVKGLSEQGKQLSGLNREHLSYQKNRGDMSVAPG